MPIDVNKILSNEKDFPAIGDGPSGTESSEEYFPPIKTEHVNVVIDDDSYEYELRGTQLISEKFLFDKATINLPPEIQ